MAWSEEIAVRWQRVAEEVYVGLKDWRLAHPRATLAEIETALDERLGRARARMLEDLALASAAADLTVGDEVERQCKTCGGRLQAQGRETRQLTTTYEQTVTLTRSAARCPACGSRVFPPG
jgi:DNA-directed RNA polymerase subunit RPC12/RpoP